MPPIQARHATAPTPPWLHVTGVMPMGNWLPDGGRQAVRLTPQVSEAAAENAAAAPFSSRNSSTRFVGQVMAGGLVSTTVTVAVQEAVAPLLSLTMRVTNV